MDKTIVDKMNHWGATKTPFLFIIDFESLKPLVFPLEKVPDGILFKINKKKNYRHKTIKKKLDFKVVSNDAESYKSSFDQIMQEINFGNSYLLNLCARTEVEMNLSLKEIFYAANAKYKLYVDHEGDKFTVFSPEIFIQIRKNRIFAHPMKGTIDANLKGAEQTLMQNPKEQAEHYTIVDLIRNDLNMVAKNVKVKRYRYLENLKTNNKDLLQTSSMISGTLDKNYHENIGSIINKLLPAGSITGAPKNKTVEIIKTVESHSRGYYTGIMGYYDGERLDAGIMIRFIEESEGKNYYRSGGGITFRSDCEEEFEELNNKIYVPIEKQ